MGKLISTVLIVLLLLSTVLLGWVAWKMMPMPESYVSDMEFSVLQAEWREPALDTSIEGNPITIHGNVYEKGIGIHAVSEISVEIPSGYTHFVTEMGIDDEVSNDNPASAQFLIMGDGAILYESPIMTPDMYPRLADVRIAGMRRLTLIVRNGGDGSNSDHGDWAGARFVKR